MPQLQRKSPAAAPLYRRIQRKLGTTALYSDHDLARLVDDRLQPGALDAFTGHGISIDEIHEFILPRRTLVHRRSRKEPLTREESDRAVRMARIASLAEEVFGEDERAGRWLRKPKERFEGRTPLAMAQTDAGARLVEEMLLQLKHGFAA